MKRRHLLVLLLPLPHITWNVNDWELAEECSLFVALKASSHATRCNAVHREHRHYAPTSMHCTFEANCSGR